MKKVIILNGSPRKNFNTAQLLKEAQKGAESVGAEVEYVDLVDLNFKGCMSCFACKRKGSTTNGLCAYPDELRPILEKILAADVLIIGSPVYYSYPTGMFRNVLERLFYAAGTYQKDEQSGYFKRAITKNIPIGIIYTMNITVELYKQLDYSTILGRNETFARMLFGYAETMNAYDTYQFSDYSKYDCEMFDPEHKAKVRETQFPNDLEKAFDLGKRLTLMDI